MFDGHGKTVQWSKVQVIQIAVACSFCFVAAAFLLLLLPVAAVVLLLLLLQRLFHCSSCVTLLLLHCYCCCFAVVLLLLLTLLKFLDIAVAVYCWCCFHGFFLRSSRPIASTFNKIYDSILLLHTTIYWLLSAFKIKQYLRKVHFSYTKLWRKWTKSLRHPYQ